MTHGWWWQKLKNIIFNYHMRNAGNWNRHTEGIKKGTKRGRKELFFGLHQNQITNQIFFFRPVVKPVENVNVFFFLSFSIVRSKKSPVKWTTKERVSDEKREIKCTLNYDENKKKRVNGSGRITRYSVPRAVQVVTRAKFQIHNNNKYFVYVTLRKMKGTFLSSRDLVTWILCSRCAQ